MEVQEQEQQQQVQEQALNLYKPLLQDEPEPPQRFDNSVHGVELMSIDQCETVPELDDSQLVGAPVEVSADADVAAGEGEFVVDVEVKAEVNVAERSEGRRRRGRPPRVQARAQARAPARAPPKKKDEEDVCFICFDGGSLVLCDRRGCPKAYHPTCIKRDASFFRSKAKWNCGWHICSSCQKAAHYMCYTCTFSLCKACTKDADYLCVRANKGFCGICMRTVMLIENNAPGNKEMVQVDFDDKSSWEYLFKVYWIYLKGKLSLTLDELTRAKNPWKGDFIMVRKRERLDELYDGKDDKGFSLYGSLGDLEANNSKRRKTKEQPKFLNKEIISTEKSGGDTGRSLPEGMEWASKELLEFVAHMKNGDTSVLSQFDVQALLLEYIKRNNLRDPHRKCQIVCDMRLVNLFGKARVGHFEMLKLLESHFLIKENPQTDSIIQGGVVDSVTSQVEPHGNNDNQLMMGNNKRRKTRKKHDDKGPQINLDEYAAIDVHNINLIYLRRALMENLIDDTDKFHDKVVGSIVRIKISSSDQKQDMHRLVQVLGTSKVAEPYKIGSKTADVALEILNLNKKEVISIDGISNHEFSEDECRRLRQSIKCGLIKRLTVGEIQAKAMTLQAVRVNDWLEAEILRLNHLRDRASEHGHRKELRECVEKLQLLNSPEERQRRLHEIPEVHTDPNMNPNYESEEDVGESDDKKQDDEMRPRGGGDVLKDGGNRAQNNLVSTTERSRNICATLHPDKEGANRAQERVNKSSWNQGRDAFDSSCWDKSKNQVDPIDSVTGGWNNQAVVRSQSFSGAASETSVLPLSTEMAPSANDDETDKMWHYQDPTGKIQGPFSMVQLRKWNTSGHFPPDLRIWRINEKQDDSLLLSDALNEQHQKKPPLVYNNHLLSQEARVAYDCRDNNWDGGWSGSMNANQIENNKKEGSWNSTCNDASPQSNGNNDFVRSSGWGSCSSSWTAPEDIVNSSGGQSGSFVQGQDSSKSNNSWSGQPQVLSSLPSPTFPEKPIETPLHQGRECHKGEASNSGQNNGDLNSHRATESQTNSGQSYEKQLDSQDHAGQSSGQNWRPPPVDSSSNGWDSNSEFVSECKPVETAQQNQETDFPDLPSPTPKPSNEDSKGQAAENKQSPLSNLPVQESGLSWSTASSLVGGGAQVPEVAGEWGGHSPAPAKPPVEEWDSNSMSATTLKPIEMASDHAATPTSGSDQLAHFSPSHPASNASSWQAIVAGPDEFSTLDDDSVSDLLAEVEAMESLAGIASPTSIMNCGGDLAQGSKNDCFSSVEEFSPVPDPGKSDALSSTGDLQIPSHSAVTDEPHGVSQADVLDPQKRSGGQSSTSLEMEVDTKLSDVSVNQWDAGSDIQPFAPSTTSLDLAATDTTWRAGSETTVTSEGPVQGNANLGWGGLVQGNTNMARGAGQGMTQANANVNWGPAAGSSGIWGSQPRYGGERLFAPRERGFQGGDSGFGRGRSSWNRQSFGGGNGGGSFGPPAKGQRVCKFYEDGCCKKGASCSYLHR